jgi:2-polyprenyl-3-methyl-5-hydroxy-6-metoxy-1,4-benzoquinol methylase
MASKLMSPVTNRTYSGDEIYRTMRSVRTAMKPALLDGYLKTTVWRFATTFAEIPASDGSQALLDIGCYGPVLGSLHDLLGYRRFAGTALYDWGPFDTKVLPAWANENGIELTPWYGDVEREDLPWADESFDVVLMLEILEHFAVDPMRVLWEANRVLKPGGTLILSTPNASSVAALARLLLGHNPQPEPYNGQDSNRHNRLYDDNEITCLLRAAGFGETRIRSIGPPGARWSHRMLRLGANALSLMARVLRRGSQFARNEVLLARATKVSDPCERFPRYFYGHDPELFDDWIALMNAKNSARAALESERTPEPVT